MNCCKYTIKNIGDKVANFNFKKCDDKGWYYESLIEPNETLEVWLEINSYSTEFKTIEILSKDCNYPEFIPSPTRFTTPTVTPTLTITPSITPSSTVTPSVTLTPSFTPTPSVVPENLKLTFNCFFSDVSFYVQNLSGINFDMTVDWGDGSPVEFFTNSDNYTTYYTYNDIGIFTANVYFNDRSNIVNFSLQTSPLIDIKGLEGFPLLKTLFLNQNNLSAFTPQHPLSSYLELINLDTNQINTFEPLYPLSNSIIQLEIKNNFLSSFNPPYPLPSSLNYLDLSNNNITTFNPTYSLPTSLTELYLSYNPITGFTPTQTITNNLKFLYLNNCSITKNELQNTLNYLSSISWVAPNTLDISNQTTLACIPLTNSSYLNLISQGWSIVATICSLDLYFDNIAYADLLVGDSSNISDWNTFFNLPSLGTSFSSVSVSGNTVSLYGGNNIQLKPYIFRDYTHLLKFSDNGGAIKNFMEESFGGPLGTSSLTEIYSLGVENVYYRTFYNCNSLTSIDLPNLLHITNESFSNCTQMGSFYFPLLTTAGEYCFNGCLSATTFNLPSLSACSSWFFYNCSVATTFYLPSLVNLGGTVGDDSIFEGINTNLNTVTLTIPLSRMTCNSGFPDGDIIFLQGYCPTNIITV